MGAAMMVVAAIFVLAGLAYLTSAVASAERQMAELDPDESRATQTMTQGAWGMGVAVFGVGLFVLALLPYGISSYRMSKHQVAKGEAPTILAWASTAAIVLALLFAFLAPNGPFVHGLALASGGGGPSGAVQVETFEGELTAASAFGTATQEGVHPFSPVSKTGAIKVRMGYGGEGVNARLIAILEAADGSGGWKEVGRTSGAADSEFLVPIATYPGDLRLRVTLEGPSAGRAGYLAAVSFAPAR